MILWSFGIHTFELYKWRAIEQLTSIADLAISITQIIGSFGAAFMIEVTLGRVSQNVRK